MKKVILVFSVLSVFLSGCEKEPEPIASFSLSNYSPDVGETITATNQSINAFSYLWNHGDGTESELEDQYIVYNSPGTYTVSLTAFSESGEKQNVATETVTVTQPYGDVVFWLDTDAFGIVVVEVEGKTANITSYYASVTPECNASGCATFHLKTGDYNFAAASSNGEYTWSGSITVRTDQCTTMLLR